MQRLRLEDCPKEFIEAKCWFDEHPDKPNYKKESQVGKASRGICKICHVMLNDPAFQPDGFVNNPHRGMSLQASHEEKCLGPCPSLSKCVLLKVYGKSFTQIHQLCTRAGGTNHCSEIKSLVQQLKRRERDEKRDREAQERQARMAERESNRLQASQRLGAMYDVLKERLPEGEVGGVATRITTEELKMCFEICKEVASSYQSTEGKSAAPGQV